MTRDRDTDQLFTSHIHEEKIVKRIAITGLVLFLSATAVGYANSVDDANTGLDALNRGDFATAVHLFSRALQSGALSASDRELALMKRGQAYIGENRVDLALTDLDEALALDPNDQEAAGLRLEVQTPHARTVGDLVSLCGADRSNPTGAAKVNYCHGYAQGVVSAEFASAGGAKPFCFPNPAPTRTATLQEFAAWAHSSPANATKAAPVGLLFFLKDRYPCN
jgi:tetratricopeptide (TPR) repeat protein